MRLNLHPAFNIEHAFQFSPCPTIDLTEVLAAPENWLEELKARCCNHNNNHITEFDTHVGESATYNKKAELLSHLKIIYHRLSENPDINLDKQLGKLSVIARVNILTKLTEDINLCTNGFHNRVNEIIFLMKTPVTLSQLICKVRHSLVGMAGALTGGVHTANQFFILAKKNNLGVKPIVDNDPHRDDPGVAELSEDEATDILKIKFESEYTPLNLPILLCEELRGILMGIGYDGPKNGALTAANSYSLIEVVAFSTLIKKCLVNPKTNDAQQKNNRGWINPFCVTEEDDAGGINYRDLNWAHIQTLFHDALLAEHYFTRASPCVLWEYARYAPLEIALSETNALFMKCLREHRYGTLIAELKKLKSESPDIFRAISQETEIQELASPFLRSAIEHTRVPSKSICLSEVVALSELLFLCIDKNLYNTRETVAYLNKLDKLLQEASKIFLDNLDTYHFNMMLDVIKVILILGGTVSPALQKCFQQSYSITEEVLVRIFNRVPRDAWPSLSIIVIGDNIKYQYFIHAIHYIITNTILDNKVECFLLTYNIIHKLDNEYANLYADEIKKYFDETLGDQQNTELLIALSYIKAKSRLHHYPDYQLIIQNLAPECWHKFLVLNPLTSSMHIFFQLAKHDNATNLRIALSFALDDSQQGSAFIRKLQHFGEPGQSIRKIVDILNQHQSEQSWLNFYRSVTHFITETSSCDGVKININTWYLLLQLSLTDTQPCKLLSRAILKHTIAHYVHFKLLLDVFISTKQIEDCFLKLLLIDKNRSDPNSLFIDFLNRLFFNPNINTKKVELRNFVIHLFECIPASDFVTFLSTLYKNQRKIIYDTLFSTVKNFNSIAELKIYLITKIILYMDSNETNPIGAFYGTNRFFRLSSTKEQVADAAKLITELVNCNEKRDIDRCIQPRYEKQCTSCGCLPDFSGYAICLNTCVNTLNKFEPVFRNRENSMQ